MYLFIRIYIYLLQNSRYHMQLKNVSLIVFVHLFSFKIALFYYLPACIIFILLLKIKNRCRKEFRIEKRIFYSAFSVEQYFCLI